MHPLQRLGPADHAQPVAKLGRKRIGQVGRYGRRKLSEHAPQRLDRERTQLLVHGHEPAGVDPAVLVLLDDLVLGRAHHEQSRGHRIALDEAEQHDSLPHRQDVLQERLVEEDRLEQASGAVVEPQLVDREAPGATQTRDRHLPGNGDLHPDPQVGHPRELAPVLVAHRQVEEQVLGRVHAELGERLRALRADALHELDGRLEVHRGRSCHGRERSQVRVLPPLVDIRETQSGKRRILTENRLFRH